MGYISPRAGFMEINILCIHTSGKRGAGRLLVPLNHHTGFSGDLLYGLP
jgi:hypothetical protein